MSQSPSMEAEGEGDGENPLPTDMPQHEGNMDTTPVEGAAPPLTPPLRTSVSLNRELSPIASTKLRKTRQLEPNTYAAGNPAEVKSFITVYDSEPKCGAYLGYTDLGEFRKFTLSFHFISFFVPYSRYCFTKPVKVALELIRDLQDPDEDFPEILQTAITKYPIVIKTTKSKTARKQEKMENDKNSNYMLATLLYRFASYLEGQVPKDPQEAQAAQANAIKRLSEFGKGRKIPHDFDVATIQLPKLGPHTALGEHRLEKYNRVYNLLRSFASALAPSRWKEKFEKEGVDPFGKVLIHPSSIPMWMVEAKEPSAVNPLLPAPPPPLPKKSIVLYWNRNAKTKSTAELETHIQNFINFEELELPPLRQPCLKDPRVYPTGEMWRDTLRRQLLLQDLGLEFITIYVETVDSAGETQNLLVFARHGSPAPWTDVKSLLLQTNMEATFSYTLRPWAEDEEFQLEYTGPPLGLMADLRLDAEGDVELQPERRHEGPRRSNSVVAAIIMDEDEAAETAAFLSGGGNALVTRRAPLPSFDWPPDQREEMLAQHDGQDVCTTDGLLAWQLASLDKVCGIQPKLSNEAAFKGNAKITPSQKKELAAHRAEGEQAALAADSEELTGRYFQIQAAFTGADTQVGPPIDPCKVALGMRTVGKHVPLNQLDISECTTLPGCDIKFLDSQINSAAFMLQRSLGKIPISEERAKDPSIREAAQSLESVKTFGGYVVDGTGFGKTMASLLFASQYGKYADHTDGYRPMCIIVPNGAVFGQWVDAIWTHFRDLHLIISNDDKPSETKYLNNWVSSTAMREAPKSLDNWPERLNYVFDTKDPRAAMTVFVTPYDTHKDRTVDTAYKKTKDKDTDKSSKGNSSKDKSSKAKKRHGHDEEPVFTSRWAGRFSLTINDEGHRLRHTMTKTFASVCLLRAPINWLLTATPVMNSLMDILGGLMLLWPSVQEALKRDVEAIRWLRTQEIQGYAIFEQLSKLPRNDIRRTIALDPRRIEKLLLSNNVAHISKYFHFMDELISIRRSTASVLPRDFEKTKFVELKTMMPKHIVKTVELEYKKEEAAEAQWLHRQFSREYVEALKDSLKADKELVTSKKRIGPDTYKNRQKFPPTTGPLRRLTITAKSTKLARLDIRMRALGFNTLVKDMEGYRARGHSADWFIAMTHQLGDPSTGSRAEKLQYLAEGSPTLRYLLSQIRDYLLQPHPEGKAIKLLVAEDTPIVAWYWEMVSRFLYVDARVLHSGLTNEERRKLVEDFNTPSASIKVLIMMYNVGSQGTNLDPCCSRVIVATGAINASLEIQAWGRLIRVSQREEVLVIRCKTLNSHDQTRDARQMDKAIMDMATRSWSDAIKQLLVDLLNEANNEVRAAHDSIQGQKLKGLKLEPDDSDDKGKGLFDLEFDGEQELAQTVSDEYDIQNEDQVQAEEEEEPTRRQKRIRRQTQRLINDRSFFGDDFELGSSAPSDSQETPAPSDSSFDSNNGDSTSDADSERSSSPFDPLGKNDNPAEDVAQDDGGDYLLLQPKSNRQMREYYNKLSRKDQESFDQDEISLRTLLGLDPDRVYTIEDLTDEEVHDRALRLLYRARFGQLNEYARISPHINYDQLDRTVSNHIKSKLSVAQRELTYYASMAKEGTASKASIKTKEKRVEKSKQAKAKSRAKSKAKTPTRKRRTGDMPDPLSAENDQDGDDEDEALPSPPQKKTKLTLEVEPDV